MADERDVSERPKLRADDLVCEVEFKGERIEVFDSRKVVPEARGAIGGYIECSRRLRIGNRDEEEYRKLRKWKGEAGRKFKNLTGVEAEAVYRRLVGSGPR